MEEIIIYARELYKSGEKMNMIMGGGRGANLTRSRKKLAKKWRVVLDFRRATPEIGGTHLGIIRRYNLGSELRADGVYLILS